MAERVLMLFQKGGMVPADERSTEVIRERGFKVGDTVSVDIRKPRNPQFHRLVHAFGKLCSENIDALSGLTAHAVIKRLQVEGNISCEEIALNFPGIGPCSYRVPKSTSFESMDDGEFRDLFSAMTKHLSLNYWPECSPEQIERMAEALL